MAQPKKMNIRNVKASGALLFTSAGRIAGGQTIKLPASEATKLIGKGYAVKVIVRRKARNTKKDADPGDDRGIPDPAGKQDEPATPDAPQTATYRPGAEHTLAPPHSDTLNDS